MSTNKYDNQFKKKFSILEKRLIVREKAISDIMNSALSSGRIDNAYWNSIRVQLNQEYVKVSALTTEWANTEIPKQYSFVLREQMAKAKSLKSITNEAKLTVSQLLKSNKVKQIQTVLAQSAINDINSGLLLGRRNINRLIGQTRQTLIAESLIDTSLIKEIQRGNIAASKILSREETVANRLLKANKDNKYITIMNKNGQPMNYRISYYTEMVYRVKWHEAQSEAVKMNNANWDTDLIRVSNHNTTTEICQQYEGKIFSMSGKNKDFPVADQTPPYHVNCLHYITTTFAESLKVQGNYKEYSQFSKDKINRPPGQTGFVPVKERNKITNKAIKDTKDSKKYKDSTIKQKRVLIRDNVSEAIGQEARKLAA